MTIAREDQTRDWSALLCVSRSHSSRALPPRPGSVGGGPYLYLDVGGGVPPGFGQVQGHVDDVCQASARGVRRNGAVRRDGTRACVIPRGDEQGADERAQTERRISEASGGGKNVSDGTQRGGQAFDLSRSARRRAPGQEQGVLTPYHTSHGVARRFPFRHLPRPVATPHRLVSNVDLQGGEGRERGPVATTTKLAARFSGQISNSACPRCLQVGLRR